MQKALLLQAKDGEYTVSSIPIPTPTPGTILVKTHSASLNPADWLRRKLGVFINEYPAILGWDIAGDVEAVGEGVEGFQKGDRVFTPGDVDNHSGAFQQYAVVRAPAVVKIPPNLTYDEASVFPVVLTTAYAAFYNKPPHGMGISPPTTPETRGIYAGKPILILGGGGSVGQFAIQFARISGFSPILVTASPSHTSALQALGATTIIDRSLPPSQLISTIRSTLKSYTSEPLTLAYDAMAKPETQQFSVDVLVSFLNDAGDKESKATLGLVGPRAQSVVIPEGKNIEVVVGMGWFFVDYNFDLLSTFYRGPLPELLEKGEIKPLNVEVLPNGLAGIPDGLGRLERGEVSRLKLVARPQETA